MCRLAVAVRGAAACLFALSSLAAAQEAGKGADAAQPHRRIEAIEREMEESRQAKDRAEAQLAEAQTELSRLREESAEVERRLAGSRQRRSELAAHLERGARAHLEAREALATAMRHHWRLGARDNLKALLSGETAGEVERRLAWAAVLVASWTRQAGEFRHWAGEMRSLTEESGRVEQELAALQLQRAGQIRRLEEVAARRRAAIAVLEGRIGAGAEEIERLKRRAATLASVVENLGEAGPAPSSATLPSITSARGNLAWPVAGRVKRRFGAGPGGGQAAWDGILLEAAEGAAVRAPHAGRVVFADRVRGLGFLLVLDHGERVLSLFAYNGRLVGLRGETVDRGQVIAHAGGSGVRGQPGLYFEIRRNGKPEDPVEWLSK